MILTPEVGQRASNSLMSASLSSENPHQSMLGQIISITVRRQVLAANVSQNLSATPVPLKAGTPTVCSLV